MAKITHIFKTYFPETFGGLEEAIRQYGGVARENGFDVEVISIGGENYTVESPDGIISKFYKKTFDLLSNPFSVSFARSFKRICRDTDILHFHFPWPSAELLAIIHEIRKPSLVTFHCDIHKMKLLKTVYLPFIVQFLKKMDRICISDKKMIDSTPYLSQFRYKTVEIPYFFNEKRFENLPAPDTHIISFTQRIKKYILFTGVLRWYKGLDTLLDAAKTIDADIVIVGKGNLYKKLESRIKKEKIHNVHLMGFQNDSNYRLLLEGSKLVVLPSITPAEAFGQVLLEGLYFSKPLVSTELGTGTSIVNRNKVTGFVVRPGCSKSLSSAVNTILNDENLWQSFSKNAFQHYLSNFTASVQGEKYIRVYRSFL